jgi:hypothetical protein
MINFVGGKPGGGKTLYSFIYFILEELMNGKRGVVTNVSIRWDRLQEYINENHSSPFLLETRLRILSEAEMPSFYRYRVRLDLPVDAEGLPVFDCADGGAVYVLDELHLFFNARAWKDTGKGALFYLSQHRKLSDDVVCITQAISNVDKQFRSVAQDFSYISNHRTQKFRGFRRGSGFRLHKYQDVASKTDIPCEILDFPLDLKKAALYDTSGGVGIPAGHAADLGRKARGLPLRILWLVPILGTPLVFLLLYYGQKKGSQLLTDAVVGSGHVSASPDLSLPAAVDAAISLPPDAPASALASPLIVRSVSTRGDFSIVTHLDGSTEVFGFLRRLPGGERITTSGRLLRLATPPTLERAIAQVDSQSDPSRASESVEIPPPPPQEWSSDTGAIGIPSGRIGR